MKSNTLTGVVALAAAVGIVLSGCGSKDTASSEETSSSSATSETSAAETTTTSAKAGGPSTAKVAPRDEDAAGPNPTIASYIKENNIQESPVKAGDPGAPVIDLPMPEGWATAGPDTPEWAYGAIVYTGPEAAAYTPSIVAIVSKLVGNVDPQQILDLSPGELNNLPGFEAGNPGESSTLGDYPAVQLGGTWEQDGKRKIVAQKTVVIPGPDGVYVLQLNADGLEDQGNIVGAATDVIDTQTKISF
jgi:hypothetical protein